MATYYARFRIPGVSTPLCAQVEANNASDAKKIIEARNGKVKNWSPSPTRASKPPSWFK
ncbi:hypothetical protein [Candidatus Spongiihabitans sp.]|uniref:hypothetical protein n=1 Tax=Candidatus Spongiihabitans sp. TaxID=3101308 RepID=UPI003C7BFCE7